MSTEAKTPQAEQVRMRVLVVEDNPDMAQSMAKLLNLFGYDAEVAHDGPAALQLAAGNPFDVALLDIGLPGMNGYDVARRLREQAPTRRPLFVAITGYGQPEDRQRSAEAGIDLHLVKPPNIEHLEALLKRFKQNIDARF